MCGLALAAFGCGSSSSGGGSGGTSATAGGSEQTEGGGGSSSGGEQGGAGAQPLGGQVSGGQGAVSGASAGTNSTGGGGSATGGSESGGSAGGPADDEPNLPGNTKIKALDDAQRAILCDWYASKLGGYGHVTECVTGSVKVYDSQAQCVEVGLRYACPIVTVAQVAECTLGQVPSGGCDRPDEHCHWLDCM